MRIGGYRPERPRILPLVARLAPPVFLLALLVLVWQLYTVTSGIPDFVLPSPWTVMQTVFSERDVLGANMVPTAEIALAGFLLAIAVGLLCAVALHFSRTLTVTLYPLLIGSQTVPIIGLAPILVIIFGFTVLPKLIVVCLMCFFPIAVNTADGLGGADPEMITLLRSMGAGRWRIFREVEWPSALPSLFSGLRVAATYCVVGAIFGEWVGSSEGLGWLMLQDQPQLDAPGVFAAMVILTLMGIALFILVRALERLVLPWYHDARRDTMRRGSTRL